MLTALFRFYWFVVLMLAWFSVVRWHWQSTYYGQRTALKLFGACVYCIVFVVFDFLSWCMLLQGFVKVVKNKAYFKRYQVKFRRRRGETPACSNLGPHVDVCFDLSAFSLQRERLTTLLVSAWSCKIRTSTTHLSTGWLSVFPTGTLSARWVHTRNICFYPRGQRSEFWP